MGTWRVTGASLDTGDDTAVFVRAESREHAIKEARKRNILAESAEEVAAETGVSVARIPTVSDWEHASPNVLTRSPSGFGIAALVIGILALLASWIPFIGMLALPVAVIGLILAAIGFFVSLLGKKSSVGLPVAGGVANALAVIIVVIVTGSTASSISTAVTKAQQQAQATNQQVAPGYVPVASGTSLAAAPLPGIGVPVSQGDIEVTITGARVGPPRIKTYETYTASEPALIVFLTIRNTSGEKKISVTTWRGADFSIKRDYAGLSDDQGNTYKRIDYGIYDIVGGFESESIYPRKEISDLLVFEIPVSAAQTLTLELPAENFGGKGMLRFEIPVRSIGR